ncbi:MAG: hypothetical protein NTU45_09955, partial [Planctomycetota bacterium]|nr:hypothetical protein [Planctomycetota bacterium]
ATRSGTATVVRVAPHARPEVVYNLHVEGTARYLVGACGVVVHNSPCSEAAEQAARVSGHSAEGVIHVTPSGVALPGTPKYRIPAGYIENPHRAGSYGTMQDGKFVEKLRIDAATPSGMKGPNHSHYHLDGGSAHHSPRPGDSDPGFNP